MTSNQLASNGYQLPGYMKLGDEQFVPGELPEDLVEVLRDSRRQDSTDTQEVVSSGVTVAPLARPVEYDEMGRRRRGNVRGAEGWVETPEAEGQPPNGEYPVLAMDCEMVSLFRSTLTPGLV